MPRANSKTRNSPAVLHTVELGTRDTTTCAQLPPSDELIGRILRMIEIHLHNGNWQCAANALRSGLDSYREEVADARERLARSPAEWLDVSLAELDLPLRILNTLEFAGAETVREALELLTSGVTINNFGESAAEEVWRAVEQVGIDINEHGYSSYTEAKREKKKRDHIAYCEAKQRAKDRREEIRGEELTPELRRRQQEKFNKAPVDLVAIEDEARGCTAREQIGRLSRDQWQRAGKAAG